jgi:voltage-dependent potassium channel beta subunit
MEYRYMGKSGLQFSALSLGSWVTFGNQIGDGVAEALMQEAYDNGVNFFDNAEIYAEGRSEEVMGRMFRKFGWNRETYLVSSKVYWGGKAPNQTGLNRKHVTEACHNALRRLQVDYLDLYLCHRPDRNTPLEETIWAMNLLIQQGKILYWGTSEWEATTIAEAVGIARREHLIPPIVEQPQYHMFHRERVEVEYRRLYSEFGIGTTIWSPLASGLLTGKYNSGLPEGTRASLPELGWLKEKLSGEEVKQHVSKIQALARLASDLGTTLPPLAIAWCLKNPNVSTVLLGASKPEQLRENLSALEILPLLSSEVMQDIDEILGNKPKIPVFG